MKGCTGKAEELKVIQRMHNESKSYISFANYIKNKYRLADINMHPHKLIQSALYCSFRTSSMREITPS